jgi:hypothetical protein
MHGAEGAVQTSPSVSGRLERALDNLAAFLLAERALVIALVLGAYCIVTALRATRPFWYDELYTVYMCRLPDMSRIWAALKAGADLNPPFFYLITKPLILVFGEHPIPFRIPQMLGFLSMCVCLERVVSRRCGKLYGLAAALLPLLTYAYDYADEARPYAIVLGFSALALVFWLRLGEGNGSWISAALFTLFLTAAIQSHAYAVLVLLPFGIAELVRAVQTKRIHLRVSIGLALAAASAAIYVPLVGNTEGYTTTSGYAYGPRLSSFAQSYASIFSGLAVPLLIAFAVALAVRRIGPHRNQTAQDSRIPAGLLLHEAVCLGAFLLIPIAAVSLSMVLHGGYVVRYALPAVIGAGVLLPVFLHRSTAGHPVPAAVLVCVLFASWFLPAFVFRVLSRPDPIVRWQPVNLSAVDPALPIVISSGLVFLETDYQQPSDIARRLVFLTDAKISFALTGTNVFDHSYYILRRWYPIRGTIADYRTFLSQHRRFLVYGPFENPDDWLIQRLSQDGVSLTWKGRFAGWHGYTVLLEADTGPPRPPSAAEGTSWK